MAPTTPAPDPIASAATIDSMVAGFAEQPPISLTYQKVMASAMWAGVSDEEAVILTAISSVETSRNAIAISGKNLSGSRAWGAFAVTLADNQVNDGGWIAPDNNAAQAKTQIAYHGLHSWPSYASGAYLAAVPQAKMAQAQIKTLLHTNTPTTGQLQKIVLPPNDPQTGQILELALEWQTGSVLVPTAGAGAGAVGQLGSATAGATVQTIKPFASVLDFLNALGNPATWARIAYALIGGALIVVALRQVAAGQQE